MSFLDDDLADGGDSESPFSALDEASAVDVPFTSESGNILSVQYNIASGTLFIEFKSGLYSYDDVPTEVAFGFHTALSATTYFNDNIRDRYPYEAL